jgi:hypothetical protein
MASIKSKVLDCLNSFDVYEVAIAINSATLLEFYDVINELLQSTDDEIVSSTCGLIRDLVLFSNQHSDCETFSRNYETSSILQTIEQLLFSQNYFIRRAAVYTLGKTCSYSSVSILNQAFSTFRDSDPLLLPRLMGEMGWLGAENFWQLLDSMTESQYYMTRWAVVEILPEFLEEAEGQNELFLGKIRCLEKLRKDSNRYVQANSEYQYQILKFRSEMHNLSKPDRKKMRKVLEQNYKQSLDFSYISNRFEYYLRSKNLTQYSMDDLEKFVEIINIVIDR